MATKQKPESAAVIAFKKKWAMPKYPFPSEEEKALKAAEERNAPKDQPARKKPVKEKTEKVTPEVDQDREAALTNALKLLSPKELPAKSSPKKKAKAKKKKK